MKKRFNLIPLNYKLTLIGLVPLLLLISFFFIIEKTKKEKIEGARSLINDIHLSLSIDQVNEQLQQERRLSLDKIFNKRSESALHLQRLKTDDAMEQLDLYIDSGLNADYKDYTFLRELPSWRSGIDTDTIPYQEAFNRYQQLIERLSSLSRMGGNYTLISEEFSSRMELREIYTKIINYVGFLRLTVYFSLSNDQNNLDFASYNLNFELLQSYLQQLSILDKARQEHHMEQLTNHRSIQRSLALFKEMYASQQLPKQLSPDEWWDLSTKAMDDLKIPLNQTIQEISQRASAVYDGELSSRSAARMELLLCMLVVGGLVYLVINNISTHLFELQEAASKIALGYTKIALPSFAKDDLGKVARAIQRIDHSNQQLAEAADEIRKENFAVEIPVRGQHDLLGRTLSRMKTSLEIHHKKDKTQLWIQSGENLVNALLIGRRNLQEFAFDVLKNLIDYLDAEIGTYYILEQGKLFNLVSFIGLDDPSLLPSSVVEGETLMGKAVQAKKPILLENLPENYLLIKTSLGSRAPQWLLIIPLLYEHQVEGIIEIASVRPLPEAVLLFAESISPNIGAAIHAVKSRIRLQELLEETQAQTEELQVQQTELENLNVELEAQANKLQASEEELRVQQEELLETNHELEIKSQALEEKNEVILERNLEIQKKAEDLERSTRYKSEFLANMSHELRTPLNSILLLSRLLSENNEGNLLEEQIEYANVIQTSGNGLLTLIDEILDLSKIEAGKMDLSYESVSIDGMLQDLQHLFGPMASDKGLKLLIQKEPSVPERIQTDNLRVQQILRNLLSNALKFTSKGSITVQVRLSAQIGMVDFVVTDTGIGIPKEKHQLVFEAFQQADGSTRRKFGGTGLGLSISKELARLLGGTLYINSEVVQGSEFIAAIPMERPIFEEKPEKEEPVSTPITAPSVVSPPLENIPFVSREIPNELEDDRDSIQEGDKILLIIEDDTKFARALVDFSRKNGYKVVSTVRGDLGIAFAERYKPHAILLDIELPVKNGWQVMDEIKSNPNTRHIPVHIMSSHEVKRESITKGAIDFIRKPMALEQISQVFARVEKALSAGPQKVLIIEDNMKHAQALAHYLESFEVKTDISKDIQSGINLLKSHSADCVILDMGIPDAQAYRTLEAIKSDAGMEHLPVIIFTGKQLSPSEEMKIKQYADSIVVKTAHSYERILDEVALFLHLVEESTSTTTKKETAKLNARLKEVLSGKTVLIADDDIRNIFSLTKTLERYKINVLPANDGKEALSLLEHHSNQVDIVLMDMMMPEMDGYETITRIRQQTRFKNLPIIAVTAKAMMGDREKCIAAGASDYISKPVDIDQLISLLRVWLYQ